MAIVISDACPIIDCLIVLVMSLNKVKLLTVLSPCGSRQAHLLPLTFTSNFLMFMVIFFIIILSFRANWVRVNGTKYQAPCVLVVGTEEDPVFGHVHNVLVYVRK